MSGKDFSSHEFEVGFLDVEIFESKLLDETQAVYHEKYRKMTSDELLNRYVESHKNPKRWEKLAKYYVEPHQDIPKENKNELASIIRTAPDERIIQNFLKEHPYFLTRGIHPAHHGQVCIPKPQLGNQYGPDFFIAGLDSAGWSWFGVELENPTYSMFTRTGEVTKELKHAFRQIEDWRIWLTDNISYARDELGFMHIDGDLPCFVFIGRRENERLDEDTLLKRRRAVKKRDNSGLYVHHYEWLLDATPTLEKVKD
jgi:hypothetical protein